MIISGKSYFVILRNFKVHVPTRRRAL